MSFTVNMPHQLDPPLTPGPGPEQIGIQNAPRDTSLESENVMHAHAHGDRCPVCGFGMSEMTVLRRFNALAQESFRRYPSL
jgi:hypothetical protein